MRAGRPAAMPRWLQYMQRRQGGRAEGCGCEGLWRCWRCGAHWANDPEGAAAPLECALVEQDSPRPPSAGSALSQSDSSSGPLCSASSSESTDDLSAGRPGSSSPADKWTSAPGDMPEADEAACGAAASAASRGASWICHLCDEPNRWYRQRCNNCTEPKRAAAAPAAVPGACQAAPSEAVHEVRSEGQPPRPTVAQASQASVEPRRGWLRGSFLLAEEDGLAPAAPGGEEGAYTIASTEEERGRLARCSTEERPRDAGAREEDTGQLAMRHAEERVRAAGPAEEERWRHRPRASEDVGGMAKAVHAGTDAPACKDAYIMTVCNTLVHRARLELGTRMCGYLGYGGFCIHGDTLSFKAAAPEEIEALRVKRPKHTLVVCRCPERPKGKFAIVPMGHFCLTAGFLRQTGYRHQAYPVDWSAHTFKVWQQMLKDDFATLLHAKQPGEQEHPYNRMFPGEVNMFLHQGGFADEAALPRRVDRLRKILADEGAFGFSIYFSGRDNTKYTYAEVEADACKVLDTSAGFAHIALVWFEKVPLDETRVPPAVWSRPHRRLSTLRYTPSETTNFHDGLRPHDVYFLAQELEAEFPEVFCRIRSEDGDDDACSVLSNETEDSWTASVMGD